MVEEGLVEGLRMLVSQQAADGQLLVDEVGHGQLLTHHLRGHLGGEETSGSQQGLEGGGGGRSGRGPRAAAAGALEGGWVLGWCGGLLAGLRGRRGLPARSLVQQASRSQGAELGEAWSLARLAQL